MKQAGWRKNGSSYTAGGIGEIASDTKWRSKGIIILTGCFLMAVWMKI